MADAAVPAADPAVPAADAAVPAADAAVPAADAAFPAVDDAVPAADAAVPAADATAPASAAVDALFDDGSDSDSDEDSDAPAAKSKDKKGNSAGEGEDEEESDASYDDADGRATMTYSKQRNFRDEHDPHFEDNSHEKTQQKRTKGGQPEPMSRQDALGIIAVRANTQARDVACSCRAQAPLQSIRG